MKAIEEMSYTELKEEIQYIASIMDDDAQARHHAAYLADLTEAFAKKSVEDKNMKQYKEIRKIRASALRQLCIDRDWYTTGDNDEYGHLLYDLADNKENLSTADIIEIATDIMEHSDLSADYTVESIAFEVARIADVFFEEI